MQSPYDGRFKHLAEDFSLLLLRLLNLLEPGSEARPIHLLRELQLDPVQVDHVYRIGDKSIVHFEAITSWNAKRVPRLALYRFLLKQKFELPVASYLVFMAEKYAPRSLPERVVYEEDDGFRIETPYRVIKLWEIDAGLAFERGNEALLPWAPLLKGGLAEFRRAVLALEGLVERPQQAPYAVDAMVSNIAALAALRYDKDEIAALLAKLREKTMLSSDVFHVSWLFKEGQAEGRAEGLLTGKRDAVRAAFGRRFPKACEVPDLNRIDQPDLLDDLLFAVMEARSEAEARNAIHRAVSR